MSRWFSAATLAAMAAALWVSGMPLARAQMGPCRVAKGDSPVARACSEGGVIAAKQTMRSLVKQGRAGGVRFECSDCHTDDESYDRLSTDARDKFAKLLAAARKK